MTPRRFILTITSPQGTTLDVSANLEIGQLGSISTSPESDLGILAHGDMAMTLDNSTGELEAFLEGAGPSDTYNVFLSRQREDGSQWDRMFGGVLDLPYSLSYDDMAKTAHVVAYSYSKKLERTPADGTAGATSVLRRDLDGKTASIAADSSILNFLAGDTADLEIGDVVELNDGTTTEQFTIGQINGTSETRTTRASTGAFTGAYASVVTPFRHDQSPLSLLDDVTGIAAEAGVEFNSEVSTVELADFPIATPLSLAGLTLLATPTAMWADVVSSANVVQTSFKAATAITKYKYLGSPDGVWADGTTSQIPRFDWTPYLWTKPATVLAGATEGYTDTGTYSADHSGSRYFWITFTNAGTPGMCLVVNQVGQASFVPVSTDYNTDVSSTEFDPASGRVFISYYRKSNALVQEFLYWTQAGGYVWMSTAGTGGHLRSIRYLNTNLLCFVDIYTNALKFFSGADCTVNTLPPWKGVIDWPNTTDHIYHWTMRAWGTGESVGGVQGTRWLTFLVGRRNETWVWVVETAGDVRYWRIVAEYRLSYRGPDISDSASSLEQFRRRPNVHSTVFQNGDGEQMYYVFISGDAFVLATRYAGVVRYADFKDSSCAKAARDVATCINSVVDFNQFGVMTVRNRKALGDADPVMDLGVPLTSTRYPISEVYRSSVTVKGRDSNGQEISETQGASGDSARRLTIESDLITTPGMALACAITTLQFVSQIREQRDVTVIDDGTPLAVFDRVTMGGKTWLIYKLETDLEQQIHAMTLLELQP